MIHGAELRVHFLKSFQKGSTCENLSQKGLKSEKVGHGGGTALDRRPHAVATRRQDGHLGLVPEFSQVLSLQ
jgi:hypothetical protein